MSLFIIVVLVYAIALARISQPSSNRIYLPIPSILGRVCFIFRAFACDLLLLILVRSLWMAHPHFMCMHVCTITLRLIPTDSPMLSTNFPIDKSIYFKGIQNIVWLVPKQFQIVVSSSFQTIQQFFNANQLNRDKWRKYRYLVPNQSQASTILRLP